MPSESKKEHVFDRLPPSFRYRMGIPIYLACPCGRRWYASTKDKPRDACKRP